MNSRHIIISTAIGVTVGLAVGLTVALTIGPAGLLSGDPNESPSPAPVRSADVPAAAAETRSGGGDPRAIESSELAAIRDTLEFERDARFAMAEELDLIWDELAKLSETDAELAPAKPASPKSTAKEAAQRPEQEWFDTESLLKAGVPEHDVKRLRERFDAQQLDELYLRDTATREGWVSSARFRKDQRRLEQDMRSELGDEDYDRVRFASGKNNGVSVEDVLQNSAAEAIGLRKGDVIVRYDGKLMLSPKELRTATTGGAADQTTSIDILRGNETLRFYVPRGPIGVRIGQTRRQPE